ncbi:hypothetical protein [Aliagarivorans taiwanensis]|uniref:hypothetical protein n=1 Tax=Aliagarivorans taiwanensis TaxID=561966 RepID=UPI0003FA0208|nr:hypothetical protein [Aliagarivorans taiwanensis]
MTEFYALNDELLLDGQIVAKRDLNNAINPVIAHELPLEATLLVLNTLHAFEHLRHGTLGRLALHLNQSESAPRPSRRILSKTYAERGMTALESPRVRERMIGMTDSCSYLIGVLNGTGGFDLTFDKYVPLPMLHQVAHYIHGNTELPKSGMELAKSFNQWTGHNDIAHQWPARVELNFDGMLNIVTELQAYLDSPIAGEQPTPRALISKLIDELCVDDNTVSISHDLACDFHNALVELMPSNPLIPPLSEAVTSSHERSDMSLMTVISLSQRNNASTMLM